MWKAMGGPGGDDGDGSWTWDDGHNVRKVYGRRCVECCTQPPHPMTSAKNRKPAKVPYDGAVTVTVDHPYRDPFKSKEEREDFYWDMVHPSGGFKPARSDTHLIDVRKLRKRRGRAARLERAFRKLER